MNTEPRQRLAERGALLVALLRREKGDFTRRVLLWGGLRVLCGVALAAAVLVILGAVSPVLPRILSLPLAVSAWAGLGFLAWRHWVRPLRAVPNLAVFSRLVEERRDFRDMLRSALEFSQRGAPEGQSVDLVAATVDRAYEEARKLRLTQFFDFGHKRRDAVSTAGGLVVAVVVSFLSPGAPRLALQGLAFAWPTPGDALYGHLQVLSGDVTVLAGEDVEVAVRETGPQSPEVVLRFNDTGDLWKSRLLPLPGSTSPRDYVFRFERVRDDLSYRFENGRDRTAEHRIHVAQRPIVSQLRLRLVPPEYTGRKPVELEEGRGDAVALLGTRVEITAQASEPLTSAVLVPDGNEAEAVTLAGPQAMQTTGKTFGAGFVLRGDLRYHFDLVDSLGHTNADAITYQLSAVLDRAPYVEVRVPGGDADIPKSMQVPLTIYAADDFGISRLTLVYRREKANEDLELPWQRRALDLRGPSVTDGEGRALAAGPNPEVLQSFAWDVGPVGLFPGDHIAYYVEVQDNDAFSGKKTAKSPVYKLRLQTLGELYAEIQQQDESRMTQLDDAIEKGKQLQEKYEKLARELKKNPEVDWKKQKEIEGALEKQKKLAEQVKDIADQLEKEVEKMQSQQLVSQEIAQKLDEIRKLMQDVDNEALRDYMERLQEAMKQITPEEIQRAMEQMQMSQEEFLQRLERTKSLLEQLRREQKLDALVERVSEMLQNQERLSDSTEKLQEQSEKSESKRGENSEKKNSESEQRDREAERLGEEQRQLSEEASEMQKELEDLAKEAQQSGQEQLQDVSHQMQEENPSGEMQEASRGLQQKQPQQAQPHQQQAEKSLRALYQQLMQAQQSMSMQAQAQDGAALAKAARQALDVSFRQEGLTKQDATPGDFEGSGNLAKQQQTLLGATGKVANDLDALAQKSLAAPPQVTQMLGEAMLRMREGVGAFEKGNSVAGRIQGEAAYGLLNQVVVELNRSSSSSCSSPGGSGSGQKLEQLMGQQQQLNDATRQFQESIPNPQNLGPEERAQMSRLLGEQRSIEGELQEIERQAAEQRDLLGRLDKMQDEMREVVQDMESDSVTEETLRIQERIVSRMLNAQRSLHKRDFNEERESRTAEEIFSQGGKPLQEGERLKKLRRDIERALRSGAPEEYEDLVRQYFRAITESETQPTPEPVP